MNYCSIEDAWQNSNTFKNNIEHFENNIEHIEDNINLHIDTQKETCDCDKLIEHILKCKKCHDKLLLIMNKNKYELFIKYLITIIQKNKDLIILIFIIIFIFLLFNLLSNILNTIFR